ncbi:MAG TPA: DUF4136 domain-containing protein [Vicinamibacteria bacterium]|nr:DUF4136 domain-containing protein [Vicinamibacteria bacterium]
MGGYGYRGWGGMGMGTATTTESEYTVGTLVVDVFGAKQKNLLWRGSAEDELSDKPEKNVKNLAKASDKLFKDFPPGEREEEVVRAPPRRLRSSRDSPARRRLRRRPGRGGVRRAVPLGGRAPASAP